jgi:hypothetical protein
MPPLSNAWSTAWQSAPAAEAEYYVVQLGGAVSDIDEHATPYRGRSACGSQYGRLPSVTYTVDFDPFKTPGTD